MYFVLKILKILFILFRSTCYNTAGLEDTTNQAPHGTRDYMCSWEAPDDGHSGFRNM